MDPLDDIAFMRVMVAILIKRLGVDMVIFTDADLETVAGLDIQSGVTPEGPGVRLITSGASVSEH